MSDMKPNFRPAPQIPSLNAGGAGPVVGYTDGAIGGAERTVSLAALFPSVEFVSVGPNWPDRVPPRLTALIVSAEAAQVEGLIARLEHHGTAPEVIIALRDADMASTRRLIRAGAADVLTLPLSEAAIALSLERVLARSHTASPRASEGRVIGLLKAGGGSGATAIGTQLAAMLATRSSDGEVCFADLDLQFGQGALYLDISEAMTLTDILGGGGALEDAPLASAIARHGSGARLLGAPREMTPIDTLSSNDIDGLIRAMRRDFAVSILDLPPVWTAWTNRALQLCDRIILITHLTVPHINLAKRQLKMMASQGLDTVALTLVCNQLSPDQQAVMSLKTAEKALGIPFDLVIPEDRKLMSEAIAQGREISTIRGGSKLERAIGELAGMVVPAEATKAKVRKGLWS